MMSAEIINEKLHQLHAARYTFHKVTQTRYILEHQMGLPEDQAAEKYRRAMANYDDIIAHALTGASYEANDVDMARGFQLEP